MKTITRRKGVVMIEKIFIIGVVVILVGIILYLVFRYLTPSILEKNEISNYLNG